MQCYVFLSGTSRRTSIERAISLRRPHRLISHGFSLHPIFGFWIWNDMDGWDQLESKRGLVLK